MLTPPQNAPRPEGKTVGACRIMVDRLKGTLKSDIEALRNSTSMPDGTPPKVPTTPRKRVTKGENGADGSLKKHRRSKKVQDVYEGGVEDDEKEAKVKIENMGKECSAGEEAES